MGANWTPQQDLGDSSSEGAGGGGGGALGELGAPGPPTYSPGAQPFSLSLPRELHDKVGMRRGSPRARGVGIPLSYLRFWIK